MSMETYHGHVKSAMDAIILFEACRLGTLPRVQRRLTEKERLSIRSGSVFVWDEREAGMRRWTDGKSWSASRVSGSFLTYREMEGRREGGEVYHVSAGPVEHANTDPGAARDQSRESHSASPSSRDPSPDSIQLITTPEGYRYKPDGLMKQSFSITTSTDLRLHLISYFNRSGTEDGLLQPCEDEKLKKIKIPPGLYPDASALIDLYNNPKGKGLGPNPGMPNGAVNPNGPVHGHPNHGHPNHGPPGPPGAHGHPGPHGHPVPHPGAHGPPGPNPGHPVQAGHPNPANPAMQPFGPPQHHPQPQPPYYPNPGHPGHPGHPGPQGHVPYYHPNPMALPGYYPGPAPNGYAHHVPQPHPHHVQQPMAQPMAQPHVSPRMNGHVTHPSVGHPSVGHPNGHVPPSGLPNGSPMPGHPTPPGSHVTIKQEHVVPSPRAPSAHVSQHPSPVTTPQLGSTPKMSRVSPKREQHSPALSPPGHVNGHVRKNSIKGHVRTASASASAHAHAHARSVSSGHVSPISHTSPRVQSRAVSSPHLSHVPRSSLKRAASPALPPSAKEVKLELPSVASLLKAQDIPYEKVQWGEDTRAIQALDKGFM